MNWLLLLFFIELGYSPFYNSANMLPVDYIYIMNENAYYITLDAEIVILDHLFIGGAVKTYFQDKIDDYSFYPFEANYLFKVGLRYKNIEAGFKHWCGHGVRPWPIAYQPQGSTDGGYEEFYIRISNKR